MERLSFGIIPVLEFLELFIPERDDDGLDCLGTGGGDSGARARGDDPDAPGALVFAAGLAGDFDGVLLGVLAAGRVPRSDDVVEVEGDLLRFVLWSLFSSSLLSCSSRRRAFSRSRLKCAVMSGFMTS